MSAEKAKQYLERFGKACDVIEFPVSSATVGLAAEALGCEPARIAKSILLLSAEGSVMVVVAGDGKIDNRKYKDRFGEKPRMMPWERVEETVGYPPGGVCPFGVNEGVRIYLDESLKRFETVYPAAGSTNSAVPMTIAELERCSGALGWVDVCRDVSAE